MNLQIFSSQTGWGQLNTTVNLAQFSDVSGSVQTGIAQGQDHLRTIVLWRPPLTDPQVGLTA